MNDPEILETIMLAAQGLNDLDVLYIHLCEADWDDAPLIPIDFRIKLRNTLKTRSSQQETIRLKKQRHYCRGW